MNFFVIYFDCFHFNSNLFWLGFIFAFKLGSFKVYFNFVNKLIDFGFSWLFVTLVLVKFERHMTIVLVYKYPQLTIKLFGRQLFISLSFLKAGVFFGIPIYLL